MTVPRALLARLFGALVGGVAVGLLRLSGRRLGIVLLYHRIDDVSGDPAREISPAHAERIVVHQLRHLRRWFRVVDAEDVLEAAAARRRGRRFPAAVTFDDDLRSHVERALPVLERVDLTATFFLGGTSLDGPHEFWWERAQRAISRGGPSSAVDPAALRSLTYEQREAAVDRLDPGPRPVEAGLRADGVRRLHRAGMPVGFHTRRHEVLTDLDDGALAAALVHGRDELEAIIEQRLELIAYPHGANDSRVREAAGRAGYALGFTVAGRAVRADDDRLGIPRIVPSYRSAGGFALQLLAELLDR